MKLIEFESKKQRHKTIEGIHHSLDKPNVYRIRKKCKELGFKPPDKKTVKKILIQLETEIKVKPVVKDKPTIEVKPEILESAKEELTTECKCGRKYPLSKNPIQSVGCLQCGMLYNRKDKKWYPDPMINR